MLSAITLGVLRRGHDETDSSPYSGPRAQAPKEEAEPRRLGTSGPADLQRDGNGGLPRSGMPLPRMKNKYKVPATQWQNWRTEARGVFNAIYGRMTDKPASYQAGCLFPEVPRIKPEVWEDICWNTAWAAADYTQRFSK